MTQEFLDWACQRPAKQGKRALSLVWANARPADDRIAEDIRDITLALATYTVPRNFLHRCSAGLAGREDEGPSPALGAPTLHVHDHLRLAELQCLAGTIRERRVWIRYQAIVLAAQGRSAAGVAKALGCGVRSV